MSTVPNHHLSLPRAIVYQLTGLLGIANGGVTSYALKTSVLTLSFLLFVHPLIPFPSHSYTSRTSLAASMGAKLASADIQAAGGITITAGSLAGVATGLLYIVMMVHPGHSETRRSVLLKETGMVVFTLLFLVAALLSTVSSREQLGRGFSS